MEKNNSECIKDSNGLLTVKRSPRAGRDAATQTPTMIRQLTPTRKTPVRAFTPASSSSEESLDYEDTFSHPPSRNADVILGATVPDVVIEDISDTYPLTQVTFHSTSTDQEPFGITNLAFEDRDEMVRTPSPRNIRQKPSKKYYPVEPIFVKYNHQLLVPPNNSMDPNNRRLCYSLPRAPRKKHQEKDLQIRSQPPSPQLKRTEATDMNDAPFWIIPRESSINSLNTIPTASSNYAVAAAESVGGLYTISGKSTYVSNGFSEPVIGLYEMHIMPQAEAQVPSKSLKRFEFMQMPAAVDRRRQRRQLCTDLCSLLFLLPGLLIAAITPALVIPLFYVPAEYFIPYVLIFMASGTLAVVFLVFAGIIGNMVWYYDGNTKKLKSRIHCGKGPTFHFWGNGLYRTKLENNEKEITV